LPLAAIVTVTTIHDSEELRKKLRKRYIKPILYKRKQKKYKQLWPING